MTYKILMVDDEPDLDILIQQRFRKEIREKVYQFYFARHGLQALNIVQDHPDISVVLSDLNMPEMDGFELLKSLKQTHPNLKIIILSAYGDQDNKSSAFKKGADDFIIKPLVLSDLSEKLKKLTSGL